MNKELITSEMLVLERWPNDQLAALNLSLSWQAKVPNTNIAFQRAVQNKLIEADGSIPSKEELVEALTRTINGKVTDGTWN